MENFKTKDWAKFLDSIKPEDKNAVIVAAIAGGTTWLKFLKDQTKTQEVRDGLDLLPFRFSPFSQSFLDGLELKRIDAERNAAAKAKVAEAKAKTTETTPSTGMVRVRAATDLLSATVTAAIADNVLKDWVHVIVAATAAVGEWKLFLETLDENKRDAAQRAASPESPEEESWKDWGRMATRDVIRWEKWIGTPQGYIDWGWDVVGTAWRAAGANPGWTAAGIGVAAASAWVGKTPETRHKPTQAPTPTHTNTDTPPLHAGVQVGRPDGSLAHTNTATPRPTQLPLHTGVQVGPGVQTVVSRGTLTDRPWERVRVGPVEPVK